MNPYASAFLAAADDDAARARALTAHAVSRPVREARQVIAAATALHERAHLLRAVARSLQECSDRGEEVARRLEGLDGLDELRVPSEVERVERAARAAEREGERLERLADRVTARELKR
jgi:predicted HicB family RNase H-like nuclease